MNEAIFGSLAVGGGSTARVSARVVARHASSRCHAPTGATRENVAPAATDSRLTSSASHVQPAATSSRATTPAWPESLDDRLLAILESPVPAFETAAVGFARKELELRTIFDALDVRESRVLHRRLSCPKPDDALAKAFQRLTAERRARLVNFLADARRREALRT